MASDSIAAPDCLSSNCGGFFDATGRKMKLSPKFFLTLAFYAALHGLAEMHFLLQFTKLISPIFILVMLKGFEQRVLIGFDFVVWGIAVLYSLPFFESFASGYAASMNMSEYKLFFLAYFYCGSFFFRGFNYYLASRVIKNKKIGERVGKALH